MTDNLSVRVAQALELRERATPGPWCVKDTGNYFYVVEESGRAVAQHLDPSNASLLAASHAHCDLIAELEAARLQLIKERDEAIHQRDSIHAELTHLIGR